MGRGQLAKVHHLRPEVVDAELVDEPSRPLPVRVIAHPVAKSAGRGVARQVAYTFAGFGIVAGRVWQATSNSPLNRLIRRVEAKGDDEALERLLMAREKAKDKRHKRVVTWIKLPLDLIKQAMLITVAWLGFLLFVGCAWAAGSHDPSRIIAPMQGFLTLITWICWIVAAVWLPLILAVPWAVVVGCWHVGRKAEAAPQWCAPAAATVRRDDDITPGRVVMAFKDLGITELSRRISAMEEGGAAMLSHIRPAGCGDEVDVTPPRGATSTGAILARHDRLAENLGRHRYEVNLSVPSPGVVRVWAALPGALDEPIGPSPIVGDPRAKASYERGAAPWGVNPRGDDVAISLYQRHLLITGMSNHGKSVALRALALWLALDKTVEFRVADLKGMNAQTKRSDWEMFRDIATVFIAGPSDDHVIETVTMLEGAVEEMNRRLTTPGGSWHPLVVLVDEAQVAYMCPVKDPSGRPYGGSKNTSRFLNAVRQIQNQGRAVDVLMWQGTQDPTAQNLPVLAREGAHLRICLAVSAASKSRMALGDSAVEGGAAPHLLRRGIDKGVAVVAGDGAPVERGESSVTVRTHFINDEGAEQLARRAVELRGPVVPLDSDEPRDLLQDVHEAFGGDDKVRAAHLADRLRETGHRAYRAINGTQLVAHLAELGVIVEPGQGRHFPVVAARVLRAMDERNGVYQ